MKYFSIRDSQKGMTLIEIMISLLIGAFLMGGVLQVFIGTKQSYRMQEGLSRLQENGRYAMDLITKDIRMSGYQGCASFGSAPNVLTQPQSPNPNPLSPTLTPTPNAIIGNNNVANNWNSNACGVGNECIAGADAITVYSGGSCGGQLTGNMASNNANIQITNPNTCGVTQYDVVIISDCSSTDIFVVTNVVNGSTIGTLAHATNQNTSNFLSKAYGADAEIFTFNSFTYFIRSGASGQPALWRLDTAKATSSTNPAELVEGVENMQILYGEDTDITPDGTANYYVPANNVISMAKVVSVRASLLVRSIDDNLTAQPTPYTYNGVTTTATSIPAVTDRRLRRVFTSTIAIRNRLP